MINVSKFVDGLEHKTVAVFGLGLSGLSTIRALKKAGATLYAWDDGEGARNKAEKEGAKCVELTADIFKKCDCLVLAPGVPLTHPEPHPVVLAAKEAGIEILGDVEIFHRATQDKGWTTIGLTGTNGKSTTATLVHHILQENNVSCALAGNIGVPVLDIKPPKKGGVVVLELSSFQLDLCHDFAPDIGILLNITPDHLDRHGSIENYAAVKAKIFNKAGGFGVISVDDEHCDQITEDLLKDMDKKIKPVSIEKEPDAGVFVRGGILYRDEDGTHVEIGSLANITKLHGPHNMQNAACAYAACHAFGLEDSGILDAIHSYPGLPHRQFPVRVINGVAYINDSKATNAEATSKALGCHKNIYWIVGGRAKDGGLNGLERFMDRVRHAFLIGEAADDFAKWLDKYGVEYRISRTLDFALEEAHRIAQDERGQPGGTGIVLLSPACASHDQFKNFEERGDVFTEHVENLSESDDA